MANNFKDFIINKVLYIFEKAKKAPKYAAEL